jgi:hypothetical protein
MGEINPGSGPVEGGTERAAATAVPVFVAAVSERGGTFTGDPVRAPELDADGRFGWRLPTAAGEVEVLMPGVEVTVLRDVSSARTPCLRVDGEWSWWNGAAMLAAGASHP